MRESEILREREEDLKDLMVESYYNNQYPVYKNPYPLGAL